MINFFQSLFGTDFMPHIYCLRASPGLVWLHALSDGLIAIAYFLIPLGLFRLVRSRKDLAFHWLFLLFAVFILSCGATHILAIVTLWVPIYRFDGLVKLVTAVSSILTAGFLIALIPKIASLPSPEQWRLANEELKVEIGQRKAAEAAILSLNAELEQRVAQRTGELAEKNKKLEELTAAWDLSHGFIRQPDGRIQFWSQGSEQMYGWKKEEATGRSSHDLLHTQFPKPLHEIELELEANGSWTGELVHNTKHGKSIHVATHWVLQRGSGGAGPSVIEVNNDITDRLRAEEASQRLADLVESSDDAIISCTLAGIIDSWNGSAENLFGYPAAEIIGQPVEILTPHHRLEEEREIILRAQKGVGAKGYETTRLTKQGLEIAVSLTVSPIHNSFGRVIGISQILDDITEAKAREAAFRLSEERQRLAVDAGQVGLWYVGADAKYIWTQRTKELHGLSPDSPAPDHQHALALIHPEDRQSFDNAIRLTLQTGAPFALEFRTRGLDFRQKWVQGKGQAQRDPNGRVTGAHGTLIDLTARREMEDKLRRANTELEQFAYAAAHDLQEPLRNVALAASLLREEETLFVAASSIDARALLQLIVDNARRMEAMVKDLLDYSRVLDVERPQDRRADAQALLGEAIQNLTSSISEKDAQITFDQLPFVWMHEAHLLRVFQNLIGNALKYTGDVPPRIHIGVRAGEGETTLFVQDNGIGIAPQFHSRAFGMFKRLHSEAVKGTGIGLAVCKRIVEHYGGKIWIESKVGEGATFLFTIPTIDLH